MARRTPPPTLDDDFEERIVDVDVEQEMQGAFLEYAYSVIYSRALPDARDGLKPVQRRILFGMTELGLRPERAHVKSSRIVGEVMGKYHPHGDSAIYDALVRMAQPFTMRLPLVDGHGNFGSLDDGPAASRYTEARPAAAANLLVTGLDEDTVDLVPNYDDSMLQPSVMPAAYPNLLVNGAAGIAVGMATNMPPHNLVEVIGATRHLIEHPDASLDDLMRFVPGPDLPGGGIIAGLDGIREAYATGRGSFRTRATARIENITHRRKGIVVTELPYLVGPEKVRDKLKDLVQAKKIQGISDFKDLSDRKHGLRLVIEVKNGFHPEAVLEQLYRLTPMEDSFGVNNVALVDGQPQTLGLKNLLTVFIGFRREVVRRRSEYRLAKREERLHLVRGLLIAIADIDEVIAIVRSSDDATIARQRLMDVFDLTEAQATYILDLQLRRLTKMSRIELEKEAAELDEAIAALRALLADEALLMRTVSQELAAVAAAHGTPRRTVLLESSGGVAGGPGGSGAAGAASRSVPLEVADDPCWVLLSSTGLLARTSDAAPLTDAGPRARHDAVVSCVAATARGEFALITSRGRAIRMSALELPTLPPTAGPPTLSGGAPLTAFVELAKGERALTLMTLAEDSQGLALGTAQGTVKRVTCDYPSGRADWEMISLRDGDEVVGAAELATGAEDLVFVTSDAQLLRFSASIVRPQGRAAGGMAGVKLADKARVVFFGAVDSPDDRDARGADGADGADGTQGPPRPESLVITVAGASSALPGTQAGAIKVTPLSAYPAKGRATGGVRCQRFLKGEDALVLAWVGAAPARAASANGSAVALPEIDPRRDGSGTPAAAPIAAVAPGLPASVTGAAAVAGSSSPAGAGTVGGTGAGTGAGSADEASGRLTADRPAPGSSTGTLADDEAALGTLFDLPPGELPAPGQAGRPPRPKPVVDRSDYDPDDFGDAVQVSKD